MRIVSECFEPDTTKPTYTPISTIAALFEMSFQPTMCVGLSFSGQYNILSTAHRTRLQSTHGVQEVQLTPLELPGRSIGGIGDAGLHALDVSDVFNVVRWSVTAVTRKTGLNEARRGNQAGDCAEGLHVGTMSINE